MGINIGAALGPLVCGWLGQKVNWHYGFAAAGVGMVLGLTQFHFLKNRLGDAGLRPGHEKSLGAATRMAVIAGFATIILIVAFATTGILKLNPVGLAHGTTKVLVAVAVLYFTSVFLFFGLNRVEKQRVGVIAILFVSAAIFWAGFEQAGSSFNLFAERHTTRQVFGFEIPASWFQTLGPVFIISLAPVMAALWVALARRHLNPSLPVKFGLGLILLALGFFVMAGAAKLVAAGQKVWPTWLVTTYLVHTFGELCLSPVGLSSVTKLAPRRLVGQMMGTWFLGASVGNLIAGLVAGGFKADAVAEMPARYLQIVWMPLAAGIALILAAKPIKRWMGAVE
jgi:POT family proton-dependent oligopeptide transporter